MTHQNEDAETSNTLSDIFNPLAARAALEDKKECDHAIKEAKATSAHPTEKYTRQYSLPTLLFPPLPWARDI